MTTEPTRLNERRVLTCPVHGRPCDGYWCPDARLRLAELMDLEPVDLEPLIRRAVETTGPAPRMLRVVK